MEHIHVFRILYLSYRAYTYLTDLILVLHNLFLYYGAYTCIRILYLCYRAYNYLADLILVLQNLYFFYRYESTRRYYKDFTCTKVPIGTTQIHDTEVPVGTTGLILILQNLYLFYRYGSARRYYKDFTCTEVPVGTTEWIQRYP